QPIAVEDGGTRCGDGVALAALDRSIGDADAELDETAGDDAEHEDEDGRDPADAGTREIAAGLARSIECDGEQPLGVNDRHHCASEMICWIGSTPASSEANSESSDLLSGALSRI